MKNSNYLFIVFSLLTLVACNGIESNFASPTKNGGYSQRNIPPKALIYNGEATAYGDVEAITDILSNHQIEYQVVDSDEMNSLTLEEMQGYATFIWPGGYAGQMSQSLSNQTRQRIRKAVREAGVSYVGICAGAFLAVTPNTSWGFSLIEGELLPYYHLEDEGVESAMVKIILPETSSQTKSQDMVWWGGPSLPEVPKGVLGRYSDTNEPAITEGMAGKGLVILSAIHPEAPDEWRYRLGLDDQDGSDQDYAWTLFEAGLLHQPLPTLN